MKKTNRIISVIMTVVILVSSLLCLIPMTASAYEVDGVAYQFVLMKDTSIVPSEYMTSLGLDATQDEIFCKDVTITISNGMSGTGEIGYNASANSFYVYIYKYTVEGAYWALKYDSSGQWKYRGSADDYTSDTTSYHNYNDSDTDIYFTIGDSYYEIDSRLTMSGIIFDTSEFLSFYDGSNLYTVQYYFGNSVTMPEMTRTSVGFTFMGWTDGTNIYQAGETINPYSLLSSSLKAVWQQYAEPITYYFYNDDELYTQITVTENDTITFPEMTETKDGYTFLYWTDGGKYDCYPGETYSVTSLKLATFIAVWQEETVTEIFPDVTFDYSQSWDYELNKDNVSETMNIYFNLPSTSLNSTEVLATGMLTTNFGAPGGFYNIILDRTYKYIYFQHISTNQTILKIDTSGYWYYRVYSNLGNAGEYKKLSEYSGFFCFNFRSVDTDILPQILVSNKAVLEIGTKYATFSGEGFETFTVITNEKGIVTMPALPEGTTREGYSFQGWSDGAYIYKVGMTYDCVARNNYTFTAFWQEVSTGAGTGSDDDENFIVSFIFGTYDNLKAEIMPYFNDFEIPFLGITLADVISFLFFGLIAWIIVIIVAKVIGK